ncbi:MAG: DUF3313 domain-containing protein [Lentisphaeraceae bacterium]|nr:DUF3313 domain-containing protein [Lentisphaeraceae bacterium]
MTNFKIILINVLLLILSSCTASNQARDVKTSGFLGSDIYSKMQKGKEGQSLLVYHNPKIKKFVQTSKKIYLDPVVIWHGKDSQFNDISENQLQQLADKFHQTIYLEVSKDYEIVQQPQENTIRMEIALTMADQSSITRRIASKFTAPTRILSVIRGQISDKPVFAGEASIEVKVTEADTGLLLGAAVDRRVGGKKISAESINSWQDVYNIMDYWAKTMRFRLCKMRGSSNCQPATK